MEGKICCHLHQFISLGCMVVARKQFLHYCQPIISGLLCRFSALFLFSVILDPSKTASSSLMIFCPDFFPFSFFLCVSLRLFHRVCHNVWVFCFCLSPFLLDIFLYLFVFFQGFAHWVCWSLYVLLVCHTFFTLFVFLISWCLRSCTFCILKIAHVLDSFYVFVFVCQFSFLWPCFYSHVTILCNVAQQLKTLAQTDSWGGGGV